MLNQISKSLVFFITAILLASCAPAPTPTFAPPTQPRATQPSPTKASPPTPSTAVLLFTPVDITKKKIDYKAGWAQVTIQFVAENRGGKPFEVYWPSKGILRVKEGFTYEVRMGEIGFHFKFALYPIIPPGFRALTPLYVAEIGEATTPETIVFEQFGETSLANLASKPSFPTDLSSNSFTRTPDTIEVPGVTRLTIEGFSPSRSTKSGETALMNVTFQNLNIGQDQELKIKYIAFLDSEGVVRLWDSTVLYPDGTCDDSNRGIALVGLRGTAYPFFAGPGQIRKSQLCIQFQEKVNYPPLSPNKLKVLLWVNDQIWRVYDTGF